MKLIFTSILLLIFSQLFSQNWQWGKRIGSSVFIGPNSDTENASDIATDKEGNIYVLGLVRVSGVVTADTHLVNTELISNANNILLTSYSCDGTFRWSKIIGAPAGAFAKSVQIDTMGGVYVLANLFMQVGVTGYIGDDTTLTNTGKSLYVMRFDSSGALDWLVSPQPDTINFNNAFNNSMGVDMHVTPSGEVSVLALLPIGGNLNNTLVLQQPKLCIINYSSQGIFLNAHPMPITIQNFATYRLSMNMTKSKNGNIIVSAYSFNPDVDSLKVAGDYVKRSFIASFSSTAQLNWKHEFGITAALDSLLGYFYKPSFYGRPISDENNNLYFAGVCGNGDTLAGHLFVNNLTTNLAFMPFLIKLNAAGNLIWAQNASVNYPSNCFDIALNGNKIGVTGSYPGILRWQNSSLSLNHNVNQGRDPFIAIFNAENGNCLSLDSITGVNGFDEEGKWLTADGNSNFVVAGNFSTYLVVANDGLQAAGDSDYFIAKYGDENCIFETPNGITTINKDEQFALYPNPGTGNFILQSSENIDKIEIIDLNGRTIESWKPKNVNLVSFEFNQNGVYFLKATMTDKVLVKRFVNLDF